MKRIFTAAVCAAAMLLAFGCGKQANPNTGNEKTFTVGFDADFKPYGYVDKDGGYVGFDIDLAREVAKRNGWKIVLKPINWDAKDMELNSGAIDCIWNGFTINGREDKYEWSEPYVDNDQVILVKTGSGIKKLADLKGKIVIVQTGTPVQEALSPKGKREDLGKTFKQLLVVPDYNSAYQQLISGAADAIAVDIGVAKDKVKVGAGKVAILPETVISEKYGIGFRKGNVELRDAVQKTLKEIVKDGTGAKISAKYFDGRDVLIIKP